MAIVEEKKKKKKYDGANPFGKNPITRSTDNTPLHYVPYNDNFEPNSPPVRKQDPAVRKQDPAVIRTNKGLGTGYDPYSRENYVAPGQLRPATKMNSVPYEDNFQPSYVRPVSKSRASEIRPAGKSRAREILIQDYNDSSAADISDGFFPKGTFDPVTPQDPNTGYNPYSPENYIEPRNLGERGTWFGTNTDTTSLTPAPKEEPVVTEEEPTDEEVAKVEPGAEGTSTEDYDATNAPYKVREARNGGNPIRSYRIDQPDGEKRTFHTNIPGYNPENSNGRLGNNRLLGEFIQVGDGMAPGSIATKDKNGNWVRGVSFEKRIAKATADRKAKALAKRNFDRDEYLKNPVKTGDMATDLANFYNKTGANIELDEDGVEYARGSLRDKELNPERYKRQERAGLLADQNFSSMTRFNRGRTREQMDTERARLIAQFAKEDSDEITRTDTLNENQANRDSAEKIAQLNANAKAGKDDEVKFASIGTDVKNLFTKKTMVNGMEQEVFSQPKATMWQNLQPLVKGMAPMTLADIINEVYDHEAQVDYADFKSLLLDPSTFAQKFKDKYKFLPKSFLQYRA